MMAWQVETEMPVEEFHNWLTYFKWKAEEEAKAAEKTRKRTGKRR